MNYYSEAQGGVLREALEAQVLHWPEVSARRMFGCPAYTADGRLFVFVVNEGLVLTQLRLHDRQILAEEFAVEPFKAGERVLNHWLKVAVTDLEKLPRLRRFVQRSYEEALRY
ncbi:MAG TPA: TfoX/Sxy family protein [Anaerolineae bacterium]|nr:TfoX/Sxy family protein [Anaerolineae bacterium]